MTAFFQFGLWPFVIIGLFIALESVGWLAYLYVRQRAVSAAFVFLGAMTAVTVLAWYTRPIYEAASPPSMAQLSKRPWLFMSGMRTGVRGNETVVLFDIDTTPLAQFAAQYRIGAGCQAMNHRIPADKRQVYATPSYPIGGAHQSIEWPLPVALAKELCVPNRPLFYCEGVMYGSSGSEMIRLPGKAMNAALDCNVVNTL